MNAHEYEMQIVREATHFVAFFQVGANRHRSDFHTYREALECVAQWERQYHSTSRKGIVYAVNAAGRQVAMTRKLVEEAGLS